MKGEMRGADVGNHR